MDYIFEDDGFEVGAEIDAYCARCKADTPHTVVTKYEDEIRSVLCTTCNTTHAYRPPRGESEEEIPEPIAVRRRQTMQRLSWKDAVAGLDPEKAHSYSPRDTYRVGDGLDHPKFGLGYVSEIISTTKLEALFRDEARILVHNRADLPVPPPNRKSKVKLEVVKPADPPKVEKSAKARSEAKKPAELEKTKKTTSAIAPVPATDTSKSSGPKPSASKASVPKPTAKPHVSKPSPTKAKTPTAKPAARARTKPLAKPQRAARQPANACAKPVARAKPAIRGSKPATRAAISKRVAVKGTVRRTKASPQRKGAGR
jgi:hypothetical protein